MKLTEADNKFIADFITVKEAKTLQNLLTGESVDCNPLETALIEFIFDLDCAINGGIAVLDDLRYLHPKLTKRNKIQKFDRARDIVRKLNPTAYMTLID